MKQGMEKFQLGENGRSTLTISTHGIYSNHLILMYQYSILYKEGY